MSYKYEKYLWAKGKALAPGKKKKKSKAVVVNFCYFFFSGAIGKAIWLMPVFAVVPNCPGIVPS